ncbi:hypothetical protein GCM10023213_41450 [Prosthecobacter algae]|uniref:Zinc-or iron-chelating protein n=2 Tax=Prosthecobacter algae TaxID=1144682 RepID=A0ABP9PKF4_9BACT
MCCNGVLFHIVRLQPTDSVKSLESLGMKVSRKKKEPYFNQPCRFLRECTCTIYQDRPSRCRLFECTQIQQMAKGETSEAEAASIVMLTRQAVSRLEALLEQWGNLEKQLPLTERCNQMLPLVSPEERLILADEMRGLNQLLNQHFRLEAVELSIC